MTMHASARMLAFANSMKALWTGWDAANYGGVAGAQRRDRRRAAVNKVITGVTSFMPTPNVVHVALDAGVCGSFSWPSWRLRLNREYTADADLPYGEFLEFCVTIYHESRHCEQFFRVAQGLAAGLIAFPDQTSSSIIDHHRQTHGLGTVQERMKLFQDAAKKADAAEKAAKLAAPKGPPPKTAGLQASAEMISKWLDIPANVSTQASNNAKALFEAFEATTKPDWFMRKTIRLEVEEWMRECYKATLQGIGNWAQGDDAPFEFYKNQPTERDAHGIEDSVKELIENAIGVPESTAGNATRSDAAFAAL